jgi:hypothetical protein
MNWMMVTAALTALGLNGGCMTQHYSDSDALSKSKSSSDWKKFWSNDKPTGKPEPIFMLLTPQEYVPATGTMVAAPSVPLPPPSPTSAPRLPVAPAPVAPSAVSAPTPAVMPLPSIPAPPMPPTPPPPHSPKVTIANMRSESLTMFRLQQQKLVYVTLVPAGKAVDVISDTGAVLVATINEAPHCIHYNVTPEKNVFLIRETSVNSPDRLSAR